MIKNRGCLKFKFSLFFVLLIIFFGTVSAAKVGSSEDLNYIDPCGRGFTNMSSVLTAAGIDISKVDEMYDLHCRIITGTFETFLYCDSPPMNSNNSYLFDFIYKNLNNAPGGYACEYQIAVKLYPSFYNPSCSVYYSPLGIPRLAGYEWRGTYGYCTHPQTPIGTSCCFGSLKTCPSVGGLDVCKSNEICPGNILTGSVDNNCCSVQCVQKTCSQMGGDACASDEICPDEEMAGSSDERCCYSTCIKAECGSCSACGNSTFFDVCNEHECINQCGLALAEANGCKFTPSLIGGSCESTSIFPVTECQVIDQPGVYKLQNDIYLTPDMTTEFKEGGYCFYVVADNVVLDLNGHTIYDKIYLEKDTTFSYCDVYGDSSTYTEDFLSSGIYSPMDFFPKYSIDNYCQTGVFSDIIQLSGIGSIAAMGSNLEIKNGAMDSSVFFTQLSYIPPTTNQNIYTVKNMSFNGEIFAPGTTYTQENLFLFKDVILEESADSWGYGGSLYLDGYKDKKVVKFDRVSFSEGSSFLAHGIELVVNYDFFSKLPGVSNGEFIISPSTARNNSVRLVDKLNNPQIYMTLFNPTMIKFMGVSTPIKDAISFDINTLGASVDFINHQGLNVPANIVNKKKSYPNLRNLTLGYTAPNGESFYIVPSSLAFVGVPSFTPYVNMTYSSFEFCRNDAHCSNGKRCNAGTWRCF